MSRAAFDMSNSIIEQIHISFVYTVLKSRLTDSAGSATSTPQSSSGSAPTLGDKVKNDPRKNLLIVTATGGTIPTATGSYVGREKAVSSPESSNDHSENVTGKNASILVKGREVSLKMKSIGQVNDLKV